jgi:hypothetical protein
MREALRLIDTTQSTPPQDGTTNLRVEIFDHLAYSSYMVNDIVDLCYVLIAFSRIEISGVILV